MHQACCAGGMRMLAWMYWPASADLDRQIQVSMFQEEAFQVLSETPQACNRKIMSVEHPQDPLHGVTLEMILTRLVEKYGWQELGRRITIKCFTDDPSIKSSLKFLRRTPWARKKVEDLYLRSTKKAV